MAFHVNTETGNTGQCKASKGSCPFGGDSGQENHYATPAEAQVAAEAYMENVYKDVHTQYASKVTDGGGYSIHMKRRLIDEATNGSKKIHPAVIGRLLSKDKDELARKHVAEKLTSQKLIRDMAGDESARVRKAVAMRSNNRDVLAKLANDPDGKVRHAVMNNPKTPVKTRKALEEARRQANITNLQKGKVTAKTETAKQARVKAPVKKKVESETPDKKPVATYDSPEHKTGFATSIRKVRGSYSRTDEMAVKIAGNENIAKLINRYQDGEFLNTRNGEGIQDSLFAGDYMPEIHRDDYETEKEYKESVTGAASQYKMAVAQITVLHSANASDSERREVSSLISESSRARYGSPEYEVLSDKAIRIANEINDDRIARFGG